MNMPLPMMKPLMSSMIGRGGGANPLVFHMLDDVNGVFVNDIITGIGSETEGNTSTRYYADDSAIWQPFTTGVQGKVYAGGKWWGIGQAGHTNDQIRSNDIADAEWTASNMTVGDQDEVGLTGAAGTACTLTATAGNATVIANAITDASDNQTTRWFIKRKTGTGTVEISVDGGSTWQDVTTSVDLTAGFNECIVDQAAVTDPQIGIRVVTDTDAVIVGNAECFLGELFEAVRQSSPIFTVASPVSIGASDLSVPSGNHDDTEGLWYCEFRNAGLNAANLGGLIGLGVSGRIMENPNGTSFRSRDGLNNAAGPSVTLAADDVEYKIAMAYGGVLMRFATDGTYGPENPYDGAFDNSLGKIILLKNNTFTGAPPCTMLIRDIRRYALPYEKALAKGLELTS